MTELTDEQRDAVTAPAPFTLYACPGAGKTHVIQARHLADPPALLRGGRALLSFTQVASEEIRSRCVTAGRPDMVNHPHFVGTLDGFLWQFLVRPYLPSGTEWRRLDSWARLPAAKTSIRIGSDVIDLNEVPFTLDHHGRETIRFDIAATSVIQKIGDDADVRREWQRRALRVRNGLRGQGYLTGHDVRQLARRYLQTRPDDVLPPVRSRFREVVVDEAQDCSRTDLFLLDALHGAGVPLILVADPDQAIYAWRDADPTSLQQLSAKLGPPMRLTRNHRSSPVICSLAATLRSGGRPADTAAGPHAAEGTPVVILPTTFSTSRRGLGQDQPQHTTSERPITEVFTELAAQESIAPADCVITAERRADLPGGSSRSWTSENPATLLARAWRTVRAPHASAAALQEAARAAAYRLTAYWYPTTKDSLETISTRHRLPLRTALRHGYALLHHLPAPTSTWTAQVNTAVQAWPAPADATPNSRTGLLRGEPTVPRPSPAGLGTLGVRIDNVHQLKGSEADAVLLLLPSNDAVRRWRHGDAAHDGTLRNWYVAVTRARRLLGVAVPDVLTHDLQVLLSAAGTPHRVHLGEPVGLW
ncbi:MULTISPECIES: UvrD-helicase domain-containing protein [Actinoalloteichus]|uniref:UvrD-like helicase C-terminal domain/UvrD/REP helicase N-terminal domain n=1 Tax=Actinoalloteichus fjordicus TaxID=1612552 RepID=A0AAC9PSU4_9PSEU|nr:MULTISPECIES: UvrD-helicase domain-containing protein [Actinoalloteichus]APU15186.1 UvrD-like helicase C-terminal domain/UvrD/REP helicase N-terminal domain [Actinoalloteichus fjordicus]APU21255.1 UvrD-like helicase C-terminal domain/UvrD/REP helicase N-terminal domain [Actinoalloteichus sp. GBA129-24]